MLSVPALHSNTGSFQEKTLLSNKTAVLLDLCCSLEAMNEAASRYGTAALGGEGSQPRGEDTFQDSGAGHVLSPKGHRKKEDEVTSQSPFSLPLS